ncbi:DUF6928 family protein [Nocardioides kongjuensis]|uniref:Uncharacterized protein n=1 Tax=Nocardioides kongjuensis TaxID=349522 RepID=A0A852RK74_9ACTN|nr:hypothetical protein [Nocardioides kongjuensis]NYD31019.1 hypothetical protein [Nocardioides kongjuensis]
MGAKDWLICYADDTLASVLAARPELDRVATDALVRRLFPAHEVTPVGANEEVLEDVGDHLAFEEPYWAGELPATEDEEDEEYSFPFHPLELGEAALDHLFGFVLEGHGGPPGDTSVDPFEIPLAAYRLTAASRT